LYPDTFLKQFMKSRSFFGVFFEAFGYKIMSSVNRFCLTSSFPFVMLLFWFYLVMACIFGKNSENHCPDQWQQFSSSSVVAFGLEFWIYFSICCKIRSHFFLVHVDIQFSPYHLLRTYIFTLCSLYVFVKIKLLNIPGIISGLSILIQRSIYLYIHYHAILFQ
jgi:hypothetical protein